MTPLVRRLDAILPQTQCTKCGYPGCRPYAEAMAAGEADVNQCPPGGDATIAELAAALGKPWKPLNPVNGVFRPPQVAVIDEAICIGCKKCLLVCPVDAIVGAAKAMHTVIASWCTGCELCLPPCPVDCIALEPVVALPLADLSRARFESRTARLARDERERASRLESYE